MNENNRILLELRGKGVIIESPETVSISDEVDIERISEGVKILPGSRIEGKNTFIQKGAIIGKEGPSTVKDCWIGKDVVIKSGYVEKSVLLEKSSVGSNAHVRTGSILEEEASTAHAVGLKQTILFPFVTLGSLINFCDCFMAGGTSRKDHSEVGSSYIHFNFTPNQDKATASLIGDVPKGVMLNNSPIFLGGQGGLVGPCRLTYGNVIAAGTIQRKDELREDRLMFGGMQKAGNIPFKKGFGAFSGVVSKNIIYIGNLKALKQWYEKIRSEFVSEDFPQEMLEGLLITIQSALDERIKRLKGYFEKLLKSEYTESSTGLLSEINDRGDELIRIMKEENFESPLFKEFHPLICSQKKDNYIETIKSLDKECGEKGTLWLQSIVDMWNDKSREILPSIKIR